MTPFFKFTPFLQDTLWAGNKIGPLKGIDIPANTIGESWELSSYPQMESIVKEGPHKGKTLSQLIQTLKADLVGQRIYSKFGNKFPLIVKFIDAKYDLSVQVHPTEDFQRANPDCKSKTELWYTIEADNDAKIYAGFTKPINPSQLRDICSDQRILEYIGTHNSLPGKAYFLPGGCPHALGAGNFILEIQQCSNTTYRIYDYNRVGPDGLPRELHVDQAVRVLNISEIADANVHYNEPAHNAASIIIECPYFTIAKACVDGQFPIHLPTDTFTILVGVDGNLTLTADGHTTTLHKGETILLAAAAHSATLSGRGTAILTHA